MRKLLIFFLSTMVISCWNFYINMDNTICKIDKTEYKTTDNIEIQLSGEYLLEEAVIGGTIHICIFNAETHENQFLNLKKINNEDANVAKEKYIDELSSDGFTYMCNIEPNKNEKYITTFMRRLTINIDTPGKYFINFWGKFSSYKTRFTGDIDIEIPFTVIE